MYLIYVLKERRIELLSFFAIFLSSSSFVVLLNIIDKVDINKQMKTTLKTSYCETILDKRIGIHRILINLTLGTWFYSNNSISIEFDYKNFEINQNGLIIQLLCLSTKKMDHHSLNT